MLRGSYTKIEVKETVIKCFIHVYYSGKIRFNTAVLLNASVLRWYEKCAPCWFSLLSTDIYCKRGVFMFI